MKVKPDYLIIPSHKLTREDLAADKITVDPTIQRAFRPAYAKELAENWQDECCDPLHISRRVAGQAGHTKTEDVIIDGWHRWDGGRQAGVKTFFCIVHHGLTKKNEAAMHIRLQADRKGDKPSDVWRLRIVADSPAHIACEKVLTDRGLLVGDRAGVNQVGCLGALHRLVEKYDTQYIEQGIEAIEATWGRVSPKVWDATVVYAFVSLLGTYPGVAAIVDNQKWGRNIRKKFPYPEQFIQKVNYETQVGSGGKTQLKEAVARELLKEAWNLKRTKPGTTFPISRTFIMADEDDEETEEDVA